MESGNLKAKKNQPNAKLVRILPVETNENHEDKSGEKRVIHREWQPGRSGRYFPANLSAEKLKPILAKARVKVENVLLKDEGEFIVYRYKGRPLIRLNLKDGQFYSPVSEIEECGRDSVQHQAHIVLDVLKKSGFSNASMGRQVFQSSTRQVLSKLKTYTQDS
jgi:hypothetical protein